MLIRATFDRELRELQDDVVLLGSMVDKAIDRAMDALRRRDLEEAQRIRHDDLLINERRYAIEEKAVTLIATQQPTAGDLRRILAILHIAVDLERMGDHAEGIAKIVLMHGNEPLVKPLIDLPVMADLARKMLRMSLDAYVAQDVDAARRICAMDDDVDRLHDKTYRELLDIMLRDPSCVTRATYLTWVSHNLERIADRVTNICERVVFQVTGHLEELNVSKY